MTLYFLNQRLGSDFIPDEEGAEFESLEHAREEALAAAREVMAGMVLTGRLDLTASFEIVGADGTSLVVPFSEAVAILVRPASSAGADRVPTPREND